MVKNKSELDWEFLEDEDREDPWPPEPPSDPDRPSASAPRGMRRTVVFVIMMIVLLTAGIGTIYAHNEAQKGIAEVEQGIQSAVDVEQWSQEHAPQLTAEILVDSAVSEYASWMSASEQHLLAAFSQQETPKAELQVTDTRFRGNHAAAEVQLTLPADRGDGPLAFRQTRFYRETPQGWLRTQPVPALWGQPLELETERLDWRYRQRDEDVVLDIAQQMDALYAQLLSDYGLVQDDRSKKLVIDVRVDYLPGGVMLQERLATHLSVPSPAVYLLPPQYSEADVLAQAVGLAMLESLWNQAALEYSIGRADAVFSGIRLWELQNMGLGLSASTRNALLRRQETKDLRTTCTSFAVWMLRPMAAGVPVHCEGGQAEALSYRMEYLAGHSLRDIGWHYADFYAGYNSGWVIPQGASFLMTFVVDYAVTAYGRESLPKLLAELGQHVSWETLIPAVYGVPLDEFEEGWRQHLTHIAE